MTEERKTIKILKVESEPETTAKNCSTCKWWYKLNGNGFCLLKFTIRPPAQYCELYENGRIEKLDKEALDILAERLQKLKEMIEAMETEYSIIREIILREVKDKVRTRRYLIRVEPMKRKLLNTEKVKQYLKKKQILHHYLVEQEVKRVFVKYVGESEVSEYGDL